MTHFRTAIVLGTLSVIVPLSYVLAHKLDWPSSNEGASYGATTTLTSGDTIRSMMLMYWNSTRAYNMRHVASHGFRFSHDATDLSGHLNATGSTYTQLPAPYYDKDDDDGNRRWEEAEVTSESATFPTAGVWYDSRLYHMRWYDIGCIGCGWTWDPHVGQIEQYEQLSEQLWWTTDKWDCNINTAYAPCSVWVSEYNYPYKSAPANGPSQLASSAGGSDSKIAINESAKDEEPISALAPVVSVPDSMPFRAESVDRRDYLVVPDLSRGLNAYAREARAVAISVLRDGPARGMATFSRPLSWNALAALDQRGITIHSVEMVSDPDENGLRWTYIGPYRSDTSEVVRVLADEVDARMLGVVAAEITVDDSEAHDRLTADENLYLIDLSPEYVRRLADAAEDVIVNDVYWDLAGWH